ncbi:hypothetical protein GCM10007415_10630 [Parapedobacter pyrenivorans]|uniref:Glycosyltransferase 2-like domain-containing protein n=1 Tax=Parapedobacter pyrenivorans TaxID=1305674 RepID=A0A917HHR5_9SPHI|nr:glycosyltransferase [Parapedobacter pyrenivorans]GGG80124.1 hypothetical protein GCM10007415_10630 [Parapedobacter pyrenivorans]
MKFVVLIACHSSSESIYSTVKSLSSVHIPAGFDRVIVIENGDKPALDTSILSAVDKMPISCYFTKQKGKSTALNIAIEAYVPDDYFIIFTDDDIRFNPNWLIKYAKAFEREGRGHFFGSSLGVDYEETVDQALLASLPPSARGVDDSTYRKRPDRAFLGCNWASHKDDLMKAGLFNPNFGPGSKTGATGQEAEMQDRLRKLNLKPVLIEENLVWHYVPLEKCTIEWAMQRAERTGLERFRRKKGRGKWFFFNIVNILISGVRSIFGSKKEKYRFVISVIAMKSFFAQLFKYNR